MRRGFQENLVITLLLAGGFAFGFGWLAGAVLLWLSDAWTAREKLVGTLVVPGGLVTAAYGGLILRGTVDAPVGIAFAVVVALAAIASAVFLARSARPRRYAPSAA
jgi:hypothetical protein